MQFIIAEKNGQTHLEVCRDGGTPEPRGSAVPFEPAISGESLEDLRFYLEDYLRVPVGEYAARGEAVETQGLAQIGEALFEAVVGDDRQKYRAWCAVTEAMADGAAVEVLIQSTDPKVLSLPWELLKDPEDDTPLSQRAASFDRTIPNRDSMRRMPSAEDGLRVLMAISRPAGEQDVDYQIIARSLFDQVQAMEEPIRIDILRPPTFARMAAVLKAAQVAGRPYHVVHFDGHGTFAASVDAAQLADNTHFDAPAAAAAQGYLCFEREDGGQQLVSAKDFSKTLRESGAPIVVLNACRSGALASGEAEAAAPEASVAAALLKEGAASVVAMSHSVYVVAAAAFMAEFYKSLFAGRTVGEALNDGRKALAQDRNALRPSLKGPMILRDWMAPVHYQRARLRLLEPKAHPGDIGARMAAALEKAAAEAGRDQADPFAAADGLFFGRDAEFYTLEKAILGDRAILLHGVAGTGKTELAKGFARWLAQSGGLEDPRLAFHHRFEPGMGRVGLDAILGEIVAVLGQHQIPPEQREAALLNFFKEARCLLVWDNFESAVSMPATDGEPMLDAAEQARLLAFLQNLRATRTRVLITSRTEEPWLGGTEAVRRIQVGGLRPDDAQRYADALLKDSSDAQANRRAEPAAFKALMAHLQGNPFSLRAALRGLETHRPSAVLAGLKGAGEALPPGFEGEGREKSLGESLGWSMVRLSPADRDRLTILALFEQVASGAILGTLTHEGVTPPPRFAAGDFKDWRALLNRAARLGLIEAMGGGLYRLHPALPAYLAVAWRQAAGAAYAEEREAARQALLQAAARFCHWLFHDNIQGGDAASAFAQLRLQRADLTALLRAALDRRMFDEAQQIMQPLNAYWNAVGLSVEAAGWVDRARAATETAAGDPPEMETEAGNLWLFAVGAQANRAQNAGDLSASEHIYRQIAEAFEGQSSLKARQSLATAYHQLGIVAELGGDLSAAEGWYRRSLEIKEALNNRPGMAGSYHQLGIVAQLGGDLSAAEGWYCRSLEIEEALNNRPGMAISYHQLGMVAQHGGDLSAAEGWYRRSLEIKEALNDRPGMATSYHQLGIVAQLGGDLPAAEGWYRRSLEIDEALNDCPGMASSYSQLGSLAWRRKQAEAAMDWHIRAALLFEQFPHHSSKAALNIALLTKALGEAFLAARWRAVAGGPVPEPVRAALPALMAEITDEEAESVRAHLTKEQS